MDVPSTSHNYPGGMLAGQALLGALRRDDRSYIFRNGSWEEGQIKGAGYELRLAGDFLAFPNRPGSSDFKVVRAGGAPQGSITLAPGDSALISTVEKFCLGFDVSVLLGPKFRWSARGLLVLHGMVAHPGYGRVQNSEGEWVPKDDERLYVIVANIGPDYITIRRNDPIAYAQFFQVEHTTQPRAVDNVGFEYLIDTLFDTGPGSTQSAGLAYFRNVRDLGAKLDLLESRVSNATSTVDRVRNVTDNVVVFGVFLVSATILGVVLTTLIGLVESAPQHMSEARVTLITVLSSLYAGCLQSPRPHESVRIAAGQW